LYAYTTAKQLNHPRCTRQFTKQTYLLILPATSSTPTAHTGGPPRNQRLTWRRL